MTEQVPSEEIVDKVAYDTRATPNRGYAVRASYLKRDGVDLHDARIEIFKGDEVVRTFNYPAYRIYNIVAHFSDIVDELEEQAHV